MMAKRSPAIPTFIGSTTLSTAAAATAASMALPPPMRMRNPACAARGWLVVTIPCCAMTSALLWSFQPSDLSPRAALQAGALGSVLQTESGGSAWADARAENKETERSPSEQSLSMRTTMGRPPVILFRELADHAHGLFRRPDTIFRGYRQCPRYQHGSPNAHSARRRRLN